MIKKSLMVFCFVMFSLMVIVSGDVNITSPTNGTYVNDDIFISWKNGSYATSNLMYKSGLCDDSLPGTLIETNIVSEGNYTWGISSLSDGDYCIKIADGITLHGNVSVVIDATAPVIDFVNEPYFSIAGQNVIINANVTDNKNLKNFTLAFGDGQNATGEFSGNLSANISESHNYTTEGTYTITLTVWDKSENYKTETSSIVVNSEEPDWMIQLSANTTNMFSIPLMPEDSDINEVLGEDISDNAEKIWSYQEGEWIYNTPITSGWSSTSSRIQDIVPGYGYIIFMENDAIAYGNGKSLQAETPSEVTLTTGWNLIGQYGLNTLDITVSFSSLELGDNYYWNSVLTLSNGALTNVSQLEPEKAYWLSIKGIDLDDSDDLKYFKYLPSQAAY